MWVNGMGETTVVYSASPTGERHLNSVTPKLPVQGSLTACCVRTSREEHLSELSERDGSAAQSTSAKDLGLPNQPIDFKRCCTDRLNAHPLCGLRSDLQCQVQT